MFLEFTRYNYILTKNAQSMDTPELKLESGMTGDCHVPFGGRQSTHEDQADPTIFHGHKKCKYVK